MHITCCYRCGIRKRSILFDESITQIETIVGRFLSGFLDSVYDPQKIMFKASPVI